MKVLLIGGCGFLGSHVADALIMRGLNVRVLDRQAESFRVPLPNVEYFHGDFGETDRVLEALAGVDAVVHLASTTVPGTANLDPVSDIMGNLVATVRLLEMMRAVGPRKLVYVSSGGTVYGIPRSETVKESHPLNPINSYGIVKVAIENYLYMEHALHGLSHVILRASNPYGPRQGRLGVQGVIGTHLWKIANREPIEVWGDGTVVRDFIYVSDLADLCAEAVLSNATGCFNAGSGEGSSVNDIVIAIGRAMAADGLPPVAPVYRPSRPYDVPRIVLDISAARDTFGWLPTRTLDDGIAETWNWVSSYAKSRSS